jgi:hypothetical protein
MKKLSSTICVLGIGAALLVPAAPAAAKGGAPANCGGVPPGQFISQVAKGPGSTREAFDGPPGAFVSTFCAPGHQDDLGGI